MHNPHLDNLTLSDRVISFLIWLAIGWATTYVFITKFVLVGGSGFWYGQFPVLFGIGCGVAGAVWPRSISSFIKGIWEAF